MYAIWKWKKYIYNSKIQLQVIIMLAGKTPTVKHNLKGITNQSQTYILDYVVFWVYILYKAANVIYTKDSLQVNLPDACVLGGFMSYHRPKNKNLDVRK